MSYSPRASPISWASARYGHCLGHVRPSADRGMFVNLHKNLAARLRDPKPRQQAPRSGKPVVYPDSAKYFAYVKLLQRQRLTPRTFTGELFPCNATAHAQISLRVGDRLHKMMNIYQPAEARDRKPVRYQGEEFSLRKPVYSRDEILKILDRLAVHYSDAERSTDEERLDSIKRRFRKSQLYYPASDVREAIADYLGNKHLSGNDVHRPLSARSRAHSPIFLEISREVKHGERKHTEVDVIETSERLQCERRRVKSAPPERTRSRKVTEEELQEIIDRLAKYDDRKWPPESRNPDKIHVYK